MATLRVMKVFRPSKTAPMPPSPIILTMRYLPSSVCPGSSPISSLPGFPPPPAGEGKPTRLFHHLSPTASGPRKKVRKWLRSAIIARGDLLDSVHQGGVRRCPPSRREKALPQGGSVAETRFLLCLVLRLREAKTQHQSR